MFLIYVGSISYLHPKKKKKKNASSWKHSHQSPEQNKTKLGCPGNLGRFSVSKSWERQGSEPSSLKQLMSSFYVTQARIVPMFKVFERARVVCKTGVIHVRRGLGAALQQQPCLYRHLQPCPPSVCRCRSPLGDRSRLIPSVNGCFNILPGSLPCLGRGSKAAAFLPSLPLP